MRIELYTGFIPLTSNWQNSHHKESGGAITELAVTIRRFIDLFGNRGDVILKVCATREVWDLLTCKFPFVRHLSVQFLDYNLVLKKQGLDYNPYWYDSLRFQVLSTVDTAEDLLTYWIDEDTVILNSGLLDFCLAKKDFVISPRNFYSWDNPEAVKNLSKFSEYFESYGLLTKPETEKYTNTGTFFGGPSRNVKFLCNRILEIERGTGWAWQPSATVLEYISCYIIQELCSMYEIPYLLSIELDEYVWHYTNFRLSNSSYRALNKAFPEDEEKLHDYFDPRTYSFRIYYIQNVFPKILGYVFENDKYLWDRLVVELYSRFYAKEIKDLSTLELSEKSQVRLNSSAIYPKKSKLI